MSATRHFERNAQTIIPEYALSRKIVIEAMRKLKDSGNGNLTTALLKERDRKNSEKGSFHL
ncbi:MAG: hypothetical protein HQM10_24795 [Candidatus Riflebacteria bacterium]|nr:hypothetical protein [Candidatus Riflebacteria bacterium]